MCFLRYLKHMRKKFNLAPLCRGVVWIAGWMAEFILHVLQTTVNNNHLLIIELVSTSKTMTHQLSAKFSPSNFRNRARLLRAETLSCLDGELFMLEISHFQISSTLSQFHLSMMLVSRQI